MKDELQTRATEIEIAKAIRVSDPVTALVIRRLAFERDRLRELRIRAQRGARPRPARTVMLAGDREMSCDNCGELSTNPGQFVRDGRWVCTEACRKELCSSDSYDDLAASGGIVDAP